MHRIRGKGVVFQPPKTSKSRRQVALSPNAVLALKAHREKQEGELALLDAQWDAKSLVFHRWDGSPLRPDTVTHAFADIAKGAGPKRIRLHDLRHTHASLMLEANVHPKIVSERLGHASVAITLDTYSHVSPTLQAAAALKFDETVAVSVPASVPG